MKKLFCLLFVIGFFAACTPTEKKEDVPPPPKSPDTASAPQTQQPEPAKQPESAKQIIVNYEQTLVTSVDKARNAQARTDLGAVKDAVRNFQVENGRYPDSLDAVRSYLRPGTDLSPFNYDAATGTVTIK